MLGIAADDVFVLVDGFRQTELIHSKLIGPDLKKRLAFAFRRAGRATATTSATTAAAFLSCVWNPIMPMASFGIYCATLVVVTYGLIILFFPPLMVWVEMYLKNTCCPDIRRGSRVEMLNTEKVTIAPEPTKIEKFFGNQINTFVNKYKWLIILVASLWVGFSVWMGMKLEPLSKQEELFSDDHWWTRLRTDQERDFGAQSINEVEVTIYWGVKDIDKTGTSMWKSYPIGKAIFDD